MSRNNLKIAVIATLAYCGATMAHAQVNLSAEASSPGSPAHLSIIHLADIAGKAKLANLQVQEGQTLTNSVLNVAQGKTDIAPAPIILPFLLAKGRGPYAKQGKKGAALAANLRALYPYNAGAIGLFAHESKNIMKWSDLRGKTVFNGPPRGAALVNARQIVVLTAGLKDGTDYRGYQVNWGQLPGILVDGSVDAFIVALTFPSSRITTALAAGKVRIVSTPKEVFESENYKKIFNIPGSIPLVVKEENLGYSKDMGVSLVSSDGVFRGMGTAFADVVHKDMDFDLAKSLTAVYIANMDKLKAKAPYASNIGIGILDAKTSGFCGSSLLKYHLGAIAAWEDAGFSVPDCAK